MHAVCPVNLISLYLVPLTILDKILAVHYVIFSSSLLLNLFQV
jgi:hypothetical protein